MGFSSGGGSIGSGTDVALSNPSNGQVLTYNGTLGKWVNQSSSASVSNATSSTLGIVQLAGDLAGTAAAPTVPGLANKLNSTTAASTYAPIASPTFTGVVTVPIPNNATDASTKSYVDTTIASAVSGGATPDATTTAKGKIQLAGDLAGTASAPTVAKVNGVTLPASAPSTGNVLTATSSTTTNWTTPASAPVTSVAGKTGVVTLVETDVSNLTTDLAARLQVGGDISGTASAPTVAKVNGVTVMGIPSTGQVITASTATVASWATLPSVDYNAIPAGSTLTVQGTGGTWPARPTARTDITVQWKGPDPSPSIVSSGTGGMLNNVDIRFITP